MLQSNHTLSTIRQIDEKARGRASPKCDLTNLFCVSFAFRHPKQQPLNSQRTAGVLNDRAKVLIAVLDGLLKVLGWPILPALADVADAGIWPEERVHSKDRRQWVRCLHESDNTTALMLF